MSGGTSIDRGTFLRWAGASTIALPGVGLLGACAGEQRQANTGDASGPPPKSPTGTLNFGNLGEPTSIDPSQALFTGSWTILNNVYEGLLRWNADYTELQPALATSYRSDEDAREWVFNLREGVEFHDGEPFDSTAARRSIEYYQDGAKALGVLWGGVREIDDSDPLILRVVFEKTAPDTARNQILARMISPKLIEEGAIEQRAVGTGPYRFVTWNKGSAVIVEPNEDYWSDGPYFERIEFRTIEDPTARLTALQSGDIDFVMNADPRQLGRFRQDSRFTVSTKQSWLENALVVRNDLEPTNDARVRQAMAYALDRQAIVSRILGGQAKVAETLVAPGVYGYRPADVRYPFDPGRARELVREAGGGPLNMKLAVFAGQTVAGTEVGQAIAGQLSDVGINTEVDVLEAGVAFNDFVSDDPEHIAIVGDYTWLNGGPFHFTPYNNALDHPQYEGEELRGMVESLASTPDGAERERLLADIQNLYMEELPHVPLYHIKNSDIYRADLAGYTTPKDAFLPYLGAAYLPSGSQG